MNRPLSAVRRENRRDPDALDVELPLAVVHEHRPRRIPPSLAARMLAPANDVEIVIASHTTVGTRWYLSRDAANCVVVHGRRQAV
jgi:hypothetical protein